jgi:hypothetical protein
MNQAGRQLLIRQTTTGPMETVHRATEKHGHSQRWNNPTEGNLSIKPGMAHHATDHVHCVEASTSRVSAANTPHQTAVDDVWLNNNGASSAYKKGTNHETAARTAHAVAGASTPFSFARNHV